MRSAASGSRRPSASNRGVEGIVGSLSCAFGGFAALVDVGGRKAGDRASPTEVDPSLALSNMAIAADQTPVLNHHCKHNPTAEVTDLLELEVQFLVGREPLVKEATYRRSTLDEVRPPVQDPIFGDVAHHPVEITAIQSLNLLAHKLNRIGRRELLAHLAASIPDGQKCENPRSRGGLAAIGAPRFELGTSPTRTVRATRLRHAPKTNSV